MSARKKRDLGPFESLVAEVRRHGREAEELEERLTKALNEAYMQGARDARKAVTGHDPKVQGGENR